MAHGQDGRDNPNGVLEQRTLMKDGAERLNGTRHAWLRAKQEYEAVGG